MFQPCSPPVLVHLFNCLFSNLCPLCRHKTGWESCWTTTHVEFTWTKILHGSFMGICDGRIELQSCLWKLHSSHLFFKRWTGNFMLKLAFLRFTTSTNTSAQRRRTSTAIICRSLNTFGALPGKENFWYGGLWCQNSFHTLSQNIPLQRTFLRTTESGFESCGQLLLQIWLLSFDLLELTKVTNTIYWWIYQSVTWDA